MSIDEISHSLGRIESSLRQQQHQINSLRDEIRAQAGRVDALSDTLTTVRGGVRWLAAAGAAGAAITGLIVKLIPMVRS